MTTNKCNIGREKKEKLTELTLLYGKAKWRLFNAMNTPCDGFAAVFTFDDVMSPADRCSICGFCFWWFRRDSLGGRHHQQKIQGCQIDQQIQRWLKDQLKDSIANKGMAWPSRYATSKLDDSPQHRNISSTTKQFNVQIERLMFCKAIRPNATLFMCTLYYSTLR